MSKKSVSNLSVLKFNGGLPLVSACPMVNPLLFDLPVPTLAGYRYSFKSVVFPRYQKAAVNILSLVKRKPAYSSVLFRS